MEDEMTRTPRKINTGMVEFLNTSATMVPDVDCADVLVLLQAGCHHAG